MSPGAGVVIAGGGIAAATIATWTDDPDRSDLASGYYTELVLGEHGRHLESRHPHGRRGGAPTLVELAPGGTVVRFTADTVETAVVVDGRVCAGRAVRLPDGTLTRWLGSFDLLVLARLSAEPVPRLVLVARLQEEGLEPAAARAALSWAIRHRVMTERHVGPSTLDESGRQT